jgi:hypothetical protein
VPKISVVPWLCEFYVVQVRNQSPGLVRSQGRVKHIIQRILTYKLLTGEVEHIAQPSVVALSVNLPQIVLIYIKL